MSSKDLRADLTLLKRYMTEVEKTLEEAYKIRDSMQDNSASAEEQYRNFMLELSRASGIFLGASQEITLLVGDLQKLAQYSIPTKKENSSAESFLEKIMQNIPKNRNDN